jgi:glucosamine--fructose-6-phosphate aminotransferase (isomerizing)
MCGIFGVSVWGKRSVTSDQLRGVIDELFRLSSSRGKEASGLAIHADDGVFVYKKAMNAKKLIKFKEFNSFYHRAVASKSADLSPVSVIGHARLVTNGNQGINENNLPTVGPSSVAVHNGIIVNDEEIWAANPDMDRPDSQLDSTVITYLFDKARKSGDDPVQAYRSVYSKLRGQAATIMLRNDSQGLVCATNFGSLYAFDGGEGIFICASEGRFLEELRERNAYVREAFDGVPIRRYSPFEGCFVDAENAPQAFNLKETVGTPNIITSKQRDTSKIIDLHEEAAERRRNLRRCSKCILPETLPGISFDGEGVCNYCRDHVPFKVRGKDALLEAVEPYRRKDGSPELLMGVSGGRDSCFGLHYAHQELGLNTVAYTYDWALVTDLARRNTSRMTYDMGIEHLLVSADIQQKRRYIRDNVNAWLRDPNLGIIPLFMAGDKLYFYYYNKLRKERNIDLVITCGNRFEKTDFKSGFCGVYNESYGEGKSWRPYDMSIVKKARYMGYFAWHMGKNPGYWNSSLVDTGIGFWSSYFQKHDFVWLYDYIEWNEDEINSTLKDQYGWEGASDTDSTWRVGDGTAAFYNYIYYTVAGFSEIDTFRSNQIRDGQLDRETALKMAEVENAPRYESIREYANVIGFDFDRAMFAINSIEKLY